MGVVRRRGVGGVEGWTGPFSRGKPVAQCDGVAAMATVAGLYGFGDDSRARFFDRQRKENVTRDDTYVFYLHKQSHKHTYTPKPLALCPPLEHSPLASNDGFSFYPTIEIKRKKKK